MQSLPDEWGRISFPTRSICGINELNKNIQVYSVNAA